MNDIPNANTLEGMLTAGLLVALRVSAAVVTMPVFNSAGVPARVKALLVMVLCVVLAPVAAAVPGARLSLSAPSLIGEVGAGLAFGLSLMLLNESVLFAASLMSTSFSFSLANLMDPNSLVETEVLGTALGWLTVLVLLAAGLHRTMLSALMRTLVSAPVGSVFNAAHAGAALVAMASGIFLAGVQLASPVVAASLLVEVAVGLLGRMAPALPAQIASVPVKTMVSYVVLIGALALWPSWVEHRLIALLDHAQRSLQR